MKKGKRFLLALCVLLIAGAMNCLNAAKVLYSGDFGKDDTGSWIVNDEGGLWIRLPIDGKIPNYEGEGGPWLPYKDLVDHLELESHWSTHTGLTRIGKEAFECMKFPKGTSWVGHSGHLYLDGTFGAKAMYIMDAPELHLEVAPTITDFELPRQAMNGNIPVVRLTNVRVINEHAFSSSYQVGSGLHNMIDLGGEIRMLKAGALANAGLWHSDGTPSVFIQSATPPSWKRLDEKFDWVYEYPFGNQPRYGTEVIVVVPYDKLSTYKTAYHSSHSEVSDGYMCAYYTGSNCKSCSTAPCGRFVPGAPIYKYGYGVMDGWWYIDENSRELHVGSLDGECPAGTWWKDDLAQYITDHPSTAPKTIVLHNIEYIPDNAFSNASLQGIETVVMPKSLKEIGYRAFKGATSIKKVMYNENDNDSPERIKLFGRHTVGLIDSEAFKGCTSLEKVEGLQFDTIGNNAFEGCTALTTVNYNLKASSPTVIGAEAFKDCPQLKYIDFETVVEIRNNAFENNLAIETLRLTRECYLWNYIFKNSHLKKIYFGEKNIKTKYQTFLNCSFLTDLYMGHIEDKTQVQIDGGVFDSNRRSSIKLHVDYLWAAPYENSVNFSQMQIIKENIPTTLSGTLNNGRVAWVLTTESGTLTFTPVGSNGAYENVKGAFYIPDYNSPQDQPWYNYRDQIKGIMLMSARDSYGREYGITEIGKNAFSFANAGESRITDISIPRACTKIGESAFKNNDRLVTVHIEDVENIGSYAFENCSTLRRLDLGDSLKRAGDYVFRNCPKLNHLKIDALKPATVTQYTFAEIGNGQTVNGPRRSPAAKPATDGQQNVTLEVPLGALNNYLLDPQWNKFHFEAYDPVHGNVMAAGIYGDGNYILYADSLLVITAENGPEHFKFPSEVRFGTSTVQIMGNPTVIPDSLFMDMEKLSSITLPESVTKLGRAAFKGTPRLEYIDLSNIRVVGYEAFATGRRYDASLQEIVDVPCGLTQVSLPSTTLIDANAFSGCIHMKSVRINGNAMILSNAFKNCDALKYVELGECNLNASGIFSGCDALEEVTYSGTKLPKQTFFGCSSLSIVRLGSKLVSIGEAAFGDCTSLDTIYISTPLAPAMEAHTETVDGITWTYNPLGYKGVHAGGQVEVDYLIDAHTIRLVVPAVYQPKYRAADYWKDMVISAPADDERKYPISFPLGDNGIGTLDAQGNLTIDARGTLRSSNTAMRSALEVWGAYITNSITFSYSTQGVYSDSEANDLFGWMTKANLQKWGIHAPSEITFGTLTKYIGQGLFYTDAFSPYNVTFNCYAIHPPEIRNEAFNYTYLNAGGDKPELHVLSSALAAYQASAWNDHFDIIGDLTPQAAPTQYTVTFIDGVNGDTVAVNTVDMGMGVTTLPEGNPYHVGYPFKKWSGNYKEVYKDETVVSVHEYTTFTVTFMNGNQIHDLQTVPYYGSPDKPAVNPVQEGMLFKEWNRKINHLTADVIVDAVFESLVPVEYIRVSPGIESYYLHPDSVVGKTLQLTATVQPYNAASTGIVWSSSADSVATVDQNGLVTFADFGYVEIYATADDGSGISGECTIFLFSEDELPVYITDLALEHDEITIMLHQDPVPVRFVVTPEDYNGGITFFPSGEMHVESMPVANDPKSAPISYIWALEALRRQENFTAVTDTLRYRAEQFDWEVTHQAPEVRLVVHIIPDSIFTENSVEGVPVRYRVLDLEKKTCEVYGYTKEIMPPDPELGPVAFYPAVPATTVKVTIPSTVRGFSVIRTSESAFAGCTALQEIEFSNGFLELGTGPFAMCDNLQKLILPASFKYLEDNAATGLQTLANVAIRAEVPPIGWYLWRPLMRGEMVDLAETHAFENISANAVLHVPQESVALYQVAPWTTWFSSIVGDLKNAYTVQFVDYDGSEIETQTIDYGLDATAPADPVRPGRTFLGWDKTFTHIDADITVTARYRIDELTVTFKDWNGTVLQSVNVAYGQAAVAPTDPSRDGYVFKGWDKTFDVVTENLVITAQYAQLFTVTFQDYDGTELKVETVEAGQNASAPIVPSRSGYTFTGWSEEFLNVQANIVTVAEYDVMSFKVTFLDWDGTKLDQQTVEYGQAAVAPADPVREGYTFTGWDTDFSYVTKKLIIYATYTEGQGFEQTNVEIETVKYMLDGQIYIRRGDRTYTIQGIRVQ